MRQLNAMLLTPTLPRRSLLRTAAAWGLHTTIGATAWVSPHATALPTKTLHFPRDFGSHPDLATEWWYITGHVQADGRPWGFQLTFFRSRVDAAQTLQSPLAAKQLVFAHVALCDVQGKQLLHDQRMARAGLGLADTAEHDTDVRLQDWRLQRHSVPNKLPEQASRYAAQLHATDFALELDMHTTQPVLLQGQQGLSRKGPEVSQASYYYTQPQLAVTGYITVRGQRMTIEPALAGSSTRHNRAWLDHECSTALLHPDAEGWDWIGMNLFDGSALTAFQLRRSDGSALWGGGSWRAATGQPQIFSATDVHFTPLAWWSSPLTATRYPIRWLVQTPQARYLVRAVVNNQELDSRATTGAIYWEGLSDLFLVPNGHDAQQPALDKQLTQVGRGYLEMTGYTSRMKI